jgi:hypothetical protein
VAYTPVLYQKPVYIEPDQYAFTVRVDVHLTCNGPIYKGVIYAIDHYTTDPGPNGAVSGSGVTCHDSCSAHVYYTRTLNCYEEYDYTDTPQITGWWKKTSANGKENVSAMGPAAGGSAFYPPVCP